MLDARRRARGGPCNLDRGGVIGARPGCGAAKIVSADRGRSLARRLLAPRTMANDAAHGVPLPGATSHKGFDAGAEAVYLTLVDTVEALQHEGIPYLLIGGLASALLGRPRCSGDIDVVVKPEHARPALDALERAGFTTEETNVNWLFKAAKDGVLVDLLFKMKGDIYLDDEMLARAPTRSLRDLELRVMPAEDLLVIKALAHDEETPRHWYDALGLISGSELEWDYLVRRAGKGPRRVLSLLLYAQSVDLFVPDDAIRQLYAKLFGPRDP